MMRERLEKMRLYLTRLITSLPGEKDVTGFFDLHRGGDCVTGLLPRLCGGLDEEPPLKAGIFMRGGMISTKDV